MDWSAINTRLRRFLRDPDGGIWTDAELLQYYNDSALEIAIKTGCLVRVEAHYYPPQYDFSYTYDWEANLIEGTGWQVLIQNQASGMTICYPWEAAYWLDTLETPDDGYRLTHPWEAYYGLPADPVQVPLHGKFDEMLYCAYDEEPIYPVIESDLAREDGYYRTTSGQPSNYYQPDQAQNRLVIYPRPSLIFQETKYTDVLDDEGGLEGDESWLDMADAGMTLDVIDTADALFTVYQAMPQTLEEDTDIPDLAPYLVKYVEYATLERAFGADTDGFIPTLRDYWGLRKKAGIEAIKKWKRLKLINREYRLGGGMKRPRGRHPRLPEHFPATDP